MLCGWLTTPLLKADLGKMPQALLCRVHTVNKCQNDTAQEREQSAKFKAMGKQFCSLKKYCILSQGDRVWKLIQTQTLG